eukprot:364391-Chlamydomonas_euryale.AAC.2
MATPVLAASAAALGVYYMYANGRGDTAPTASGVSGSGESAWWWSVERPPESWSGSLYYLADAFRCVRGSGKKG